uniref:S-protein homolog n=1 Tax=Nelumbo nucifera TaxID=4432 RepID=A0A822ZG50_NELNU|nr:TPA_asm: hypothetical protein HUJ06_000635 [Nelumbo nucifera]
MGNTRVTGIIHILILALAMAQPSLGSFYLGKRVVSVKNGLNVPLRIQCWSKDNDIGLHWLRPNQKISWSFMDDVFAGTKFYCFVAYGKKYLRSGSYKVYNSRNDGDIRHPACYRTCAWMVARSGLYAWDAHEKRWQLERGWPRNRPTLFPTYHR